MTESDTHTDDTQDPWLTLAEIATELRVNPSTVRAWVSRGQLRAVRAGQRKWLVRRSEVDRMLEAGAGGRETPPGTPPVRVPSETADGPPMPGERSWIPEREPSADRHAELRAAIEGVMRADELWRAAIHATRFAPPDAGFASRVRGIADACEQEAAALAVAAARGLGWTPDQRPGRIVLSSELRPGANRPGPSELWVRFDATVERLGIATQGLAVSAVARAFGEVSEIAREIADALDAGGAGASARRAG